MELKEYMKRMTPGERADFAKRANTSVVYISQISHGHRRAGIKTIKAIEDASGGKVTAKDLRPDIYGKKSA